MFSALELTKLSLSRPSPNLAQRKRGARKLNPAATTQSMTLSSPYHPTVDLEKVCIYISICMFIKASETLARMKV